ncbi:hypothetical protein PIB30_069636 [Stylosanthes scabra]|uniref:Uncharacterized protein n=1 Tax=Stylosanthes scabra TaxID=79078 RepID=A0ABU6SQ61_9FABA|nr:hypothetical protein [Stylosanthes scabra]
MGSGMSAPLLSNCGVASSGRCGQAVWSLAPHSVTACEYRQDACSQWSMGAGVGGEQDQLIENIPRGGRWIRVRNRRGGRAGHGRGQGQFRSRYRSLQCRSPSSGAVAAGVADAFARGSVYYSGGCIYPTVLLGNKASSSDFASCGDLIGATHRRTHPQLIPRKIEPAETSFNVWHKWLPPGAPS